MAEDAPRWRELEGQFEDLVRPAPDVVLLTYRAGAVRGEGEGYRALVSRRYVKRDGAWKMMFHQQTPLAG